MFPQSGNTGRCTDIWMYGTLGDAYALLETEGESGVPAPGRSTARIHSKTSAGRKLALAMRDLCNHIGGSRAAICRRVPLRSGTMSRFLSGERVPPRNTVEQIYKAIEGMVRETAVDDRLPFTLADLLTLRDRAAIKHCPCCPEGREEVPSATQRPGTGSVKPAAAGVPGEPVSVLPVPSARGDRQHMSVSTPAQPPLTGTVQYLASGRRPEEIRVAIRYTGTVLPVAEVADAVGACRAVRLDETAEAILNHAGGRPLEDVLRLAQALYAQGLHLDVGILLNAALPAKGELPPAEQV